MSPRPKQTEMKTTARERRRNWNPRKWAQKHLNDGGGLPTENKIDPANMDWEDITARAMKNIASNASRRASGWPQDPDLPDYQPEKEVQKVEEVGDKSPGLIVEPGGEKSSKEQM